MNLTALDWIVIAVYFLLTLGIGLLYSRRARGNTSEFFLSGRNAPWWLAGTSMVATSFAADTPLAVTGIVARNGIAGNWLWWSMVMSGLMTVFFYARVWRRSEVMTDVEFAELRYSGKPAAFLRGFRALYLGIPINCIVLGWVNLAMVKVLQGSLGVSHTTAFWMLGGMLVFTAFYTTIAGLWGVLVTDFFQFILMMTAAILLAVFAVNSVGGIESLKARVANLDLANSSLDSRLRFFPRSRFGLDAGDYVLCVFGRQLVGDLVSGIRTGRRRLRGAAYFFREGRAKRRAGHAVVQHCPLFAAALALDSHRACDHRSLSGGAR
ncbi:MAG: hypothetical protein L0228_20870 [Planctomycetes bacterium]|nr:hypothetical protein [Planctomycetota bacterium]